MYKKGIKQADQLNDMLILIALVTKAMSLVILWIEMIKWIVDLNLIT